MRFAIALAFIVSGLVLNVSTSSARAEDMVDTRDKVFRTEAEKAFIFDQMRLLLTSITEIERGLGSNDMDLVAREAAARGRKANAQLARPPLLAAKESDAWKAMFLSVRTGFDVIAEQARSHAPAASINSRLAETMQNCVACHQSYRIAVEQQ